MTLYTQWWVTEVARVNAHILGMMDDYERLTKRGKMLAKQLGYKFPRKAWRNPRRGREEIL